MTSVLKFYVCMWGGAIKTSGLMAVCTYTHIILKSQLLDRIKFDKAVYSETPVSGFIWEQWV
jgi:hypothetical protein